LSEEEKRRRRGGAESTIDRSPAAKAMTRPAKFERLGFVTGVDRARRREGEEMEKENRSSRRNDEAQ